MNIDRNFSNKDSFINSIGLISPIDLDENEDDVSLFEHRGKPDPKNVRKREEQKRRGELRRKNAEKRRLEMEKRKNKKAAKSTPSESSEKTKKTETKKEQEKQTKDYDFTQEHKNKQENKVLVNQKVDEIKQHISDSKSKCTKVVKSIKTKNKKQKDIVDDIEKSVTTISKEVEDNMNNGKDVDIDDIIDREYKSIVDKHKDTKVDDEDEWGDLGKLDAKEEDFAKQFDKDTEEDEWGDLGKETVNKKSTLSNWDDDDDDDEDGYKKSYYEKKLQKLQKKYHEDIDNFEGTPQERKAIVEKYKKDKAKINQRIKETEIQDWQGFKQKKQQDKKKRRQELRKNPVINWIRMTYFKCLYPFYNAKEKIKSGINWLYGFDE